MAAENSGGGGGLNTAASSSSGAGRSGNATADSYIGSLISLTSKSEIRYEGVLYNINTDESSIGLKNVRSFGTEGRKKDGPQIPPSDKVYEYILFRGSDIKDLQVKSSPPVQPSPPINNDPAIIQSHCPRPISTATSLPPAGGGSVNDVGPHNVQMGLPGSNFPGGLSLYQPGSNLGTWGASPPPPSANGSGLPMPMYWQGYYGPPNALPHLHQHSLLRPPPGLSITPSMQQPMQYPNFNAPLPTGTSNLTGSNLPVPNLALNLPVPNLASNLPDMPPSLLLAGTSSLNSAPTSSPPSTLPLTLTSNLTPVPSATVAPETLPTLMPNKVPSSALPATNLTATVPMLAPLITSSPELNAVVQSNANKPNAISGPSMPYQGTVESSTSIAMTSSSLRTETPTPSLVTPGQLLQSGPTAVPASQPVQTAHKDVEVVQVSSTSSPPEPEVPVPTEARRPILPLPVPSHPAYKLNGTPFHNRHGHRGRERGRGIGSSRPVTKFTEDFDFEAMNEKFKKDEVWGHLGKSNRSHSKDKEDGKVSDEDDSQDEYDDEYAKVEVKPVYNKDDFFDALSCNTLDHDSQNGRIKFSEQMKIDTETFGNFSWYRGGRGSRGPPRGGHSRGSYYGSGYGYGYAGRGRGRGMHMQSRAP